MEDLKNLVSKNIESGNKIVTICYFFIVMNLIKVFFIFNPIMSSQELGYINLMYSALEFCFIFIPMLFIPANAIYSFDIYLKIKKDKYKSSFDKSYLYLCIGFLYIIIATIVIETNKESITAFFFILNAFFGLSYLTFFNLYKKKSKEIKSYTKLEAIKNKLK